MSQLIDGKWKASEDTRWLACARTFRGTWVHAVGDRSMTATQVHEYLHSKYRAILKTKPRVRVFREVEKEPAGWCSEVVQFKNGAWVVVWERAKRTKSPVGAQL